MFHDKFLSRTKGFASSSQVWLPHCLQMTRTAFTTSTSAWRAKWPRQFGFASSRCEYVFTCFALGFVLSTEVQSPRIHETGCVPRVRTERFRANQDFGGCQSAHEGCAMETCYVNACLSTQMSIPLSQKIVRIYKATQEGFLNVVWCLIVMAYKLCKAIVTIK